MKFSRCVATLTALTLLLTAPLAADDGQHVADKTKTLLLKTPSAYSTALPGLGTVMPRVAKQIDLMSAGTLKMKLYEPGKLVAPFEILEAVSSGKVNSGFTTAGYWGGKIPAAPLFTAVPFGPEAGEYMGWLYYGNGLKLYQEMYDQAGYNIHVLPCTVVSPETSGWFSKEINSIEDLQGLKIRFFGLGGKVLQRLGAAVSLIPARDIFPALEKGAIDATEFATPAIDQRLGFQKIAKYNYFPGWHQQGTIIELLINKDVWNGMSAQHRAILDNACKAAMTDSYAEGEAIQHVAMNKNMKAHGVQIRYWSPEMLSAFEKTWNEIAKEESEKDPFFAKVWADMSEFREGYKVWKSHAFLPRK